MAMRFTYCMAADVGHLVIFGSSWVQAGNGKITIGRNLIWGVGAGVIQEIPTVEIDIPFRKLGLAAALILSSIGISSAPALADGYRHNGGEQRGQAAQQHDNRRAEHNQRRQGQRQNQARQQNREYQRGQRQQAERQQAQRENQQRQRAQREQSQRQQNQRQQAQRQNEQRQRAQREQSQRQQNWRQQAQRENQQRQRAQREQSQRQQNQRQQAQRQNEQRQRAQREQSQRHQDWRQQAQHNQRYNDPRNAYRSSARNDRYYAAPRRHVSHGQGWDRWRTRYYVHSPRYGWSHDRRSRPWFDYNRVTYVSIYRPTYVIPAYGYAGYGASYYGPVGCNRDVVGAILGGVAGGFIGAHNGGDGATVGGAIIGALLGGTLGRAVDLSDQACYGQVLEYVPSNQPVYWESNDGQYQVTPLRTYQASNGLYCREYQTYVYIDGREEQAYGTACRQPDGAWRAVS